MGDHADQLFDDWLAELDSNDGWDEEPIETKTCRCCGATGLHWEAVSKPANWRPRWRLFDESGQMHVCPVKPLAIKLANGSTITAAQSLEDPIRGFTPL